MDLPARAARIRLFSFGPAPMRAFHMSWFAFFLSFFAWFGIAPMMKVVKTELGLTPEQVGNTIIASVAFTIVARIVTGTLCDRFGPRRCYAWLLVLGSLPVMGIGLSRDYETFLIFRLAIGAIGASFVITQVHTSLMFAPNCVGTANAATAGWGNLGAGAAQMAMPVLLAGFVALGADAFWGWRLSMVVAGATCLVMGVAYFLLTEDAPSGNYAELRARGEMPQPKQAWRSFAGAVNDRRVWALFVLYGACFGIELTVNNVAALYFSENFGLGLAGAGAVAALFGAMNLFTRPLGGILGDRFGMRWGLRGRVRWLFVVVFAEGLALMLFSRMGTLALAVPSLVLVALFVQMSNGATFSVVPFVNRRALGGVAGIVGAGGNAGAVAAGFLFRTPTSAWPWALLVLGVAVTCCSFLALAVRFSPAAEEETRTDMDRQTREKIALAGSATGSDR